MSASAEQPARRADEGVPIGRFLVKHVLDRGTTAYYRVNPGMVTVRVGWHGRFACLTCHTADTCPHALAARELAEQMALVEPT